MSDLSRYGHVNPQPAAASVTPDALRESVDTSVGATELVSIDGVDGRIGLSPRLPTLGAGRDPDPRTGAQLGSDRELATLPMESTVRATDLIALGHAGNDHYAGLEAFPNPGVSHVEMTSDEVTSVCPVTGQPDLYVATIEYWPAALCIESKSLKLYLNAFRNDPQFCEALPVKIRDDVAQVLELPTDKVRVTVRQKARGGITITATA